MKIRRLPDGSKEFEGTPEELAEYEESRKNESKKKKGKKEILKGKKYEYFIPYFIQNPSVVIPITIEDNTVRPWSSPTWVATNDLSSESWFGVKEQRI